MRHCVRSTAPDEVVADPKYPHVDNYTAHAWPPFPVPPMFCLPRGADIVEGQGRWWRARGGLEPPVQVVADLIPEDQGQRDNETMRRFLKGLGLQVDDSNVSLDHGPFWPCSSPECDRVRPNATKLLDSAARHMRDNPPPPGYAERLQALFAALGPGAAGNWTGLGCSYKSMKDGLPEPAGGCQAASELAERLFMEWGGGMDVAWGGGAATQMPWLLQLHTWHFFSWFTPEETYRYQGTSMARAVLRHLEAAEGGTRLFVGHDSDVMMLKGALGLDWDPAPYPANATTPGCQLHLVREGDRVSASFFYVTDYGQDSGDMATVNATFASTSSAEASFADVNKLLDKGSIAECACNVDGPAGGAAAHLLSAAELVV